MMVDKALQAYWVHARGTLKDDVQGRTRKDATAQKRVRSKIANMPLNVHTILALASKQIWPHVLTAIHFQLQRIVLLHSSEVVKSKASAERLADFSVRSGILAVGMAFQREIPYDDFPGIQQGFGFNGVWNPLDE
jgi:hypothetical protein